MARWLFLSLVLSWLAFGAVMYRVNSRGGVYDLSKAVGTAGQQPITSAEFFQVLARHNSEIMSETVMISWIRQEAQARSLKLELKGLKEVRQTLARVLESKLTADRRSELLASSAHKQTYYDLQFMEVSDLWVEDARDSMAELGFAATAEKYSANGQTLKHMKLGRMTEQAIQGRFGAESLRVIARLKAGEVSKPVRNSETAFFFRHQGRTEEQIQNIEGYLLRTEGWKQVAEWMRTKPANCPGYKLDEATFKRVYQNLLDAEPKVP